MSILLALSTVAHGADTVRVWITQDGPGFQIVDARLVQSAPAHSEPGPLHVTDDTGRVLATRPVVQPALRSVIYPEGGGDAATVPARSFVVEAPYADGATRVVLARNRSASAPPRPPAGGAVLLQGDGGPGRLDLVVLSEGYTDAELTRYASDADALVPGWPLSTPSPPTPGCSTSGGSTWPLRSPGPIIRRATSTATRPSTAPTTAEASSA